MRMSESWHAFQNRKTARREEKTLSVMAEGRRDSWEVRSKKVVTELRQRVRMWQQPGMGVEHCMHASVEGHTGKIPIITSFCQWYIACE